VVIGVGVVTFRAGLLFGYDQGVISGALPLRKEELDLSTFDWVVGYARMLEEEVA
jgi:hypothetical protein